MSDPSGKSGEILIRGPFKADVFGVLFDSVFSDIMPFFTQFPAVFPAGLNMIIYDEPCHLLSAGTCTDKCLFPIQFKDRVRSRKIQKVSVTEESRVDITTMLEESSASLPIFLAII